MKGQIAEKTEEAAADQLGGTITVHLSDTSRQVAYRLMQFRRQIEKAAREEGVGIVDLNLSAGLMLLDICEIIGLSEQETKAVLGKSYKEVCS